MDYLKNSPYGPSHKELKGQKNHDREQRMQTNVLLEEIFKRNKKDSTL